MAVKRGVCTLAALCLASALRRQSSRHNTSAVADLLEGDNLVFLAVDRSGELGLLTGSRSELLICPRSAVSADDQQLLSDALIWDNGHKYIKVDKRWQQSRGFECTALKFWHSGGGSGEPGSGLKLSHRKLTCEPWRNSKKCEVYFYGASAVSAEALQEHMSKGSCGEKWARDSYSHSGGMHAFSATAMTCVLRQSQKLPSFGLLPGTGKRYCDICQAP